MEGWLPRVKAPFPSFPINKQIDRKSVISCQFTSGQPHALPCLVSQSVKTLEVVFALLLDYTTTSLSQYIHSMPTFKKFLHFCWANFSITNKYHACFRSNQPTYVGQLILFIFGCTIHTTAIDPCPVLLNSTFAVGISLLLAVDAQNELSFFPQSCEFLHQLDAGWYSGQSIVSL